MQITKTEYNPALLEQWRNKLITEHDIERLLNEYVMQFNGVIKIKNQREHFENYLRGLMSDLARKSVEPIALAITGEQGVRALQQFMTRSTVDDEEIMSEYQKRIAESISSDNGMLSVDGSDNPKKGNDSAGVGRQYCGRLGKVENCQAGVYTAYAGSNGYGIVDRELYFQKKWFSSEYDDLREKCGVPNDKEFKTKNEIALSQIENVVAKNLFNIKWIGCDSAFGCDHNFLDSLPENIPYFAAVKNNENIFLSPKSDKPMKINSLSDNDNFPWKRTLITVGSKGAVYADVKIIRCVSCRSVRDILTPNIDVWVYIRKYENGDTKYFISNASADIPELELHEAATLRWPIEQCFWECKSNLGMGHFEGRSYNGWLRHNLFVMIAHFFTTSLRLELKKQEFR